GRLTDLACLLLQDHLTVMRHRHAPGIVTPVFELLERAQDETTRIEIFPHITKNAAHEAPPCSRTRVDRIRRGASGMLAFRAACEPEGKEGVVRRVGLTRQHAGRPWSARHRPALRLV